MPSTRKGAQSHRRGVSSDTSPSSSGSGRRKVLTMAAARETANTAPTTHRYASKLRCAMSTGTPRMPKMPALITKDTGTRAAPEKRSAKNQCESSNPGITKRKSPPAKGTRGWASKAPRRGPTRIMAPPLASTIGTSKDRGRRRSAFFASSYSTTASPYTLVSARLRDTGDSTPSTQMINLPATGGYKAGLPGPSARGPAPPLPALAVEVAAMQIVYDDDGELLDEEPADGLGTEILVSDHLCLFHTVGQERGRALHGAEVDAAVLAHRPPHLLRTGALADHPP